MLHVDLDQFIAAVEVLRRPELAGKPVIVGGRGDPAERAVVSTASYEARAFGEGSGMPLRIAARKVPDAVILPVDAEAYLAASDMVMAALRAQPGAVVQVLGWDEAFVGTETEDPEAYVGVTTVAGLAASDPSTLVPEFGPKMGPWYAQFGRGYGTITVDDPPWLARGHSDAARLVAGARVPGIT